MPAASMRGPPMPMKRNSGLSSRSALISSAPSRSPEASPATIPIVRLRAVGAKCSADDATRRVGKEVEQQLQFRVRGHLRGDFLFRVFERQPGFVKRFITALDGGDGVGRE